MYFRWYWLFSWFLPLHFLFHFKLMNFFKLNPADKVLLLGEGNFSFCANLIQIHLERGIVFDTTSITATCFESNFEEFSEEKSRNINYLQSKGVTVVCGVDVNNLEHHFSKGTDNFSKIIFNFPHVGGKMKINLNRDLLKQIFRNISDYVSSDSKVCITLCDGQGGTSADLKNRRYDDSWQVVEMAAISNFFLKHVEPFPLELFSNYLSVGYRGCDKGFHVENSLTHIFQLGSPLDTSFSDNDLLNLFSLGQIKTDFGSIICHKIYADLHSLNLFVKTGSLFNFIVKKLEEASKKFSQDNMFFVEDSLYPLHTVFVGGTASFLNGNKIKLRSSLIEVLESMQNLSSYDFSKTLVVLKGHCFSDLSHHLGNSPIEGQIMLLGSNSFNHSMEFLDSLRLQFKSEFKIEIVEKTNERKEIFIVDGSSSCTKGIVAKVFEASFGGNHSVPACIILCDPLIQILFKIRHWQELWSKDTLIEPKNSCILMVPSLYPLTFKFDVNFLVQPNFDYSKFFELLWNLTHIAVINAELIREYIPPEDPSKKYLCFRIFYKSFKNPLCRSKVLDFHKNIVSKAIELILKAPIC